MRKVILIILLGCVQGFDKETNLEWCSSYKLSWADFTGEIDVTSSFLANINTSIKVNSKKRPNTPPVYDVRAYMNQSKSWKKEGVSVWLLRHEQLHFDICELYVRKIRKSVDSLNQAKVLDKEVYKQLIFSLMDAERTRNELYDLETQHSKNFEKQSDWNKTIVSELALLETYASTPKGCEQR